MLHKFGRCATHTGSEENNEPSKNMNEIATISKVSRPYGPNRTVDLSVESVRYSISLGQGGNVAWPECLDKAALAAAVKNKSGADEVVWDEDAEVCE